MQTQCPISTISYNSVSFLEDALAKLHADGLISFWCFVHHLPEDDECGNKEHSHVYVEPSQRINTDSLSKYFYEFDPEMPNKPRKCICWRRSSTFGDWYLYGIHDRAYLASKGQSRRYHYSYDKVVSSDEDTLYYAVSTIDLVELSPYQSMIDSINHGITWEQYFLRGHIPMSQLSSYKYAYELLENNATFRNGRPGHE